MCSGKRSTHTAWSSGLAGSHRTRPDVARTIPAPLHIGVAHVAPSTHHCRCRCGGLYVCSAAGGGAYGLVIGALPALGTRAGVGRCALSVRRTASCRWPRHLGAFPAFGTRARVWSGAVREPALTSSQTIGRNGHSPAFGTIALVWCNAFRCPQPSRWAGCMCRPSTLVARTRWALRGCRTRTLKCRGLITGLEASCLLHKLGSKSAPAGCASAYHCHCWSHCRHKRHGRSMRCHPMTIPGTRHNFRRKSQPHTSHTMSPDRSRVRTYTCQEWTSIHRARNKCRLCWGRQHSTACTFRP